MNGHKQHNTSEDHAVLVVSPPEGGCKKELLYCILRSPSSPELHNCILNPLTRNVEQIYAFSHPF